MDHEAVPEPDPLTRLRAAAAAVSDLDTSEPASGDGPQDGPREDPGLDAGAQADRFEELHEALVAVLADVDRG
ncbi:hypothetical protein LQ327_15380 [Actinomycetospora endophytica]|uniref:Uncharacterized protein n=1 Tax=Actinomycetospora endophytica TaxID=2291215 RepID=A0ABS8P8Z9_9PSEU|nr:hypothetical protein [Actinomycetospora endophytica]MCD2194753.1 hypothetical protein [Actinomycetospora endophytica]